MNYESSKTSDTHRLLLNLTDKIILKRKEKYKLMNCFCDMVDQRKVFNIISCQDHCHRSPPLQISGTLQAGFEPAQNLSSGFVG